MNSHQSSIDTTEIQAEIRRHKSTLYKIFRETERQKKRLASGDEHIQLLMADLPADDDTKEKRLIEIEMVEASLYDTVVEIGRLESEREKGDEMLTQFSNMLANSTQPAPKE